MLHPEVEDTLQAHECIWLFCRGQQNLNKINMEGLLSGTIQQLVSAKSKGIEYT